jgi:hypothetical protein
LLDRLSLITNQSLLIDESTPQGLAFKFMAIEDPLMPNVCAYPTIDQRFGLATFYYATNGNNWTVSDGWMGPTNECEWYGVFCVDNLVTNLTLSK